MRTLPMLAARERPGHAYVTDAPRRDAAAFVARESAPSDAFGRSSACVRLGKRSSPGSAPTSWLLRSTSGDVVDGEGVIAIVPSASPDQATLARRVIVSSLPVRASQALARFRRTLSRAAPRTGVAARRAGVRRRGLA
jgi:hypothetical protein